MKRGCLTVLMLWSLAASGSAAVLNESAREIPVA